MEIGEKWKDWEVVRPIGQGSFGSVYEIQRNVFGTVEKAALKHITIPRDDSETEALLGDGYDAVTISRRYEKYLRDIVREYTLMTSLKGSANIVNCDDLDYAPRGNGPGWDIFIRMELLTPVLSVMDQYGGPEHALALGTGLCQALVLCEEQNIVHRDIKPQNIFVDRRGQYKLGDFGVAKVADHTTVGTRTGTFRYMAPEVYNSKPYGASADIYSLGMVMYWMLNRRRSPFVPLPPAVPTVQQEEEAQTRRLRGGRLPPPVDGSEGLKRIVLKACAFDPKKRYHDAAEMLADLRALDGQDDRPRKKTPWAYIAAAGVLAVAVLSGAVFLMARGRGGETAQAPTPAPTAEPVITAEPLAQTPEPTPTPTAAPAFTNVTVTWVSNPTVSNYIPDGFWGPVGSDYHMTLGFYPADPNAAVEWKSDNEEAVTVDNTGYIQIVGDSSEPVYIHIFINGSEEGSFPIHITGGTTATQPTSTPAPSGSREADLQDMAKDLLDSGVFTDTMSEPAEGVAQQIYGFDTADVQEYVMYYGTGATAEEIFLARCTDHYAANRVQSLCVARVQNQIASFESYVPAEVPKLQNALVGTAGQYVVLVVSNDSYTCRGIVERYLND